jgi:hypothetical protein
MDTHLLHNHHLGFGKLDTLAHKLAHWACNPRVWAVIAVCALVAAFILLAVVAGRLDTSQSFRYLEYPGYPPIVP